MRVLRVVHRQRQRYSGGNFDPSMVVIMITPRQIRAAGALLGCEARWIIPKCANDFVVSLHDGIHCRLSLLGGIDTAQSNHSLLAIASDAFTGLGPRTFHSDVLAPFARGHKKFDSSLTERLSNRGYGAHAGINFPSFHPCHGVQGNNGLVCKLCK